MPSHAPAVRESVWPPQVDKPALFAVLLGLIALYGPTFWGLAHTVWASDEQGHGPIILGVSVFLFYKLRHELAASSGVPRPLAGWLVSLFALVLYVFGRSQSILVFEVGSLIVLLSGLLLMFKGARALRLAWFPLFFLLFMIPLPGALVTAVTTPLKSAVSSIAEILLYHLGYPVARSGVVLSVGSYQLLVADACAGLNSMFTLEALGLLYMNLMAYTSVARTVTLAVLVIPIAFCANVVRVMILVLVTYHMGDEAGQGFIHGFAGMVLFGVGLVMLLIVDKFLGIWLPESKREASA